jgi:hypothetical protein
MGLVADGADGADGIFLSSSYPNDPASGPAFPAKGNVDAQCPLEGPRDAGGQRGRGNFWAASALAQKVVAAAVGAGPPKLGSRLAKCPSMSRARP